MVLHRGSVLGRGGGGGPGGKSAACGNSENGESSTGTVEVSTGQLGGLSTGQAIREVSVSRAREAKTLGDRGDSSRGWQERAAAETGAPPVLPALQVDFGQECAP